MFRSAWIHPSSWRWRTRYPWLQVQGSASYDARETEETGTHCCRARWSQRQGAGRTVNVLLHCGSAENFFFFYIFCVFSLSPQRCCCRGQPGQDVVSVLFLWATSASSHPTGYARVSSPLLCTLCHGSDFRSDALSLVSVLLVYFCKLQLEASSV